MPLQTAFGLTLVAVGFLIVAIGGYSFRRAKTTVDPRHPENATQLVVHGIYRWSRNPMYVGFFCWVLAFGIYLGSIVNLLLLPLFVVLINRWFIVPEEQALRRLFTASFDAYCQRTRRWL